MDFKTVNIYNSNIAVFEGNEIVINDTASALDLLSTLSYGYQCYSAVLKKENVCGDFFDLKTGLAGEILQKFVNYHFSVAIVGDFSNVSSKALRDFIFESNKGKTVFFAANAEDALKKLSQI